MLTLFKKKHKAITAIHPKYKRLIEKVTDIDGKPLYQFTNLLDMPHMRYNYVSRFSTEFNMHLDSETLRETVSQSLKALNPPVNLTKAIKLLATLETQINALISVDASYRLASCVYFWKDEDLNDYDFEIGNNKIELFKKMKFDDFFLSEPMNRFLPQMNLSKTDLVIYSEYEKQTKKLLTSTLKNNQLTKEGVT